MHYFEKDGYYAKNDPEHRRASRWRGRGAKELGLRGQVDPRKFERILQGYVPGTDLRLGRVRDGEHQHRPGVDVTFSAPKSVSLQALLHGDEAAMRAHDEAVAATLEFVEARLLETRVYDPKTGRRNRVGSPSLVAATFRHVASRNLDPQLHTHCVIANMTRGPDGKWRSVEASSLNRNAKLIGAHYRNELAKRLRDRGYALAPAMVGKVPGFEIAGYGRSTLDAFSSRRREVLDYIRKKGWTYDATRAQAATLATRRRKAEPRREELEALWRQRARDLGIPTGGQRKRPGPTKSGPSALEIVSLAAERLEERTSVFAASELTALVLAHSPGRHGIEDVDAAIDRLRRDGHLAGRSRAEPAFVTDRAVRAEKEVVVRMKTTIGTAAPLASERIVEERLAKTDLAAGQKDAVRTILLSADRVVGVQGYAGAGKTAMLRHAFDLVGDRPILGLAPSASATRALARASGVPARTLRSFLCRHRDVADNAANPETLAGRRAEFGGALLVVDEISLASAAQTRDLMRIADRLGVGRLALVGDRKQLRAAEAGQPFRRLQEAGMRTALMDEILRQGASNLKAAALDAVGGRPAAALGKLGDNLHEVPADELGGASAAIWLRLSPEERAKTAILAPTHELRAAISDAVRQGLEQEGALYGRELEIETLVDLGMTRAQKGDARNWREGDVAVFAYDLYPYRIRAGEACAVTGIEHGRVTLAHPDGKPRRIDPGGYIRYRLDLFETRPIRIRAGDAIRWTRNDNGRGLIDGERADVLRIGARALRLRIAGGKELRLRRDDPHLRHVAHAWASAQGTARDNLIAVLDSGHGLLSDQRTFYVEISRARKNAVVLTDNREQLTETLEPNAGERPAAELRPAPDKKRAPVERPGPSRAEVYREWRTDHDRHAVAAAQAGLHPIHLPGYEALRARLRDLALPPRLPENLRRQVAGELVRHDEAVAEAARAARCLESVETGLARREAGIASASYENWRFELESAVAAGRGVLEFLEPDRRARMERGIEEAERHLGRDDDAFAERTAVDRFMEWEAKDPGDVGKARMIAADPALPDELRQRAEEAVRALSRRAETRKADRKAERKTAEARQAANPALSGAERRRSEFDRAEETMALDRRWRDLRSGWKNYRDEVAAEGGHPFARDDCKPWIDAARTLAAEPRLPDERRHLLAEFLRSRDETWPADRKRLAALRDDWKAVRAEARQRGVSPFGMRECAAVIDRMRDMEKCESLAESEKRGLREVVSDYDAHVSRRPGLSWSM